MGLKGSNVVNDPPSAGRVFVPEQPSAEIRLMARVALPGVAFWAAKGLSTAMGESVSDWSIRAVVPELAVILGFVGFVAALAIQLTRGRYVPWAYWLAVGTVGVFGTMAADVAHVVLRVPYALSFLGCAAVLAGVFLMWRHREGTVDVHAVTTSARECYYWAAVVLTFAMGTALGDMAAVTFHLGYLTSAVAFAALILLPVIGYRFLGWNPVVCFWSAYVVTRPLGASIADWLGKPSSEGGLNAGAGLVGLVLALAMAGVVAWSARPGQASG